MQFTFADAAEHVISCGAHGGRRISAVHDHLGQQGLRDLVALYHHLSNWWDRLDTFDQLTCRALGVYLANDRIHKQICELRQATKRRPERVDWDQVRASIPAAL